MSLPPITDHAFMRLVRKRCEDMSKSMTSIAEELGCDVDELCRWVMAYKAPKKAKPYLNRHSPPATTIRATNPKRNADNFVAWRKASEGAAATRRMLEMSK